MPEIVSFRPWKKPPTIRALILYRVKEAQRAAKQLQTYTARTEEIASENGEISFYWEQSRKEVTL